MKIGVCLHCGPESVMREKLEGMRQNGFASCQLLCWEPEFWTDENAKMVSALLAEYGVVPSAFWCGWTGPAAWNFYDGQITLGLVPVPYRQMRVEQLCAGADFAKKLGITDVITHMGFIPENPYDPNFPALCVAIRTVAEHLKENGQYLLFETGQETPVTMLRCFEQVGADNLGINLDTANLILYGKANPVDALDVFGKFVRNLHAKDGFYPTNGHDLGYEVRLGDGKVDFRAFFTKLRELGYDGPVTIEREISGTQQNEDIRYAQEYLTNIITEVYGGNVLC